MTISYYLAPLHVFHDAGSSIDNTYAIDYVLCIGDKSILLQCLKHSISISHIHARNIGR
jgi:hypothetical protein